MDNSMMSEYILGDEDYGGGPSESAAGCLVFIAVGLGALIAGAWGISSFAAIF